MPAAKTRRIILIDTPFQLKLAGAFILLQLVLTGILSLALYLFLGSELRAGLASAHAAYRSLDQMLLPIVAVLAGFSLLLSTVIVTVFVVVLSHRIAGPLHRFRAVLEALRHRRISPHAQIRPDDQLGEISEVMTQAMGVLGTDLEALQATADALRMALERQDLACVERNLQELENLLRPWERLDRRV